MQKSYESYLEHLQTSATSNGLDAMRLAREEFHRLTGEFDEEESCFEVRMMMFLDWYLLDRSDDEGKTPIIRFLEKNWNSFSKEDLLQYKYLTVTLRSTFRLQAIKGQKLLLEDILRGGFWQINWTLPIVGLKQNDILDARIVLYNGSPIAGRGTVFHPKEAHETIYKIVKRALLSKMPKRQIVDHLDKMRLKLDRYSNVKIRHVYQYPDDAVL